MKVSSASPSPENSKTGSSSHASENQSGKLDSYNNNVTSASNGSSSSYSSNKDSNGGCGSMG